MAIKAKKTYYKFSQAAKCEAALGGVLIFRIPVIFWPNIPYPINSGRKYPGN